MFNIARGEAVEVAAAIEVSALFAAVEQASVERVHKIANRLVALLTGLAKAR